MILRARPAWPRCSLPWLLQRPVVSPGTRLAKVAQGDGEESGVGSPFLFGGATGVRLAPRAGPSRGLVLTGGGWRGAGSGTTLLLAAYAAGAAPSQAVAL